MLNKWNEPRQVYRTASVFAVLNSNANRAIERCRSRIDFDRSLPRFGLRRRLRRRGRLRHASRFIGISGSRCEMLRRREP